MLEEIIIIYKYYIIIKNYFENCTIYNVLIYLVQIEIDQHSLCPQSPINTTSLNHIGSLNAPFENKNLCQFHYTLKQKWYYFRHRDNGKHVCLDRLL